jgi:GTPase SAR1 family protein
MEKMNVNAAAKANFEDKIRVLVLGDSGCGKTSLVHLLCTGKAIYNPPTTIGCSAEIKVSIIS